MKSRLYRMKIWNFPECGEEGYHSYTLMRLTPVEYRQWVEALENHHAGEVVAVEVPHRATEGPWRIVRGGTAT